MLSSIAKTLSVCQTMQSVCGVAVPKRMSSHFTYHADDKAPIDGPTTKLNMFQAINNALDTALSTDDSAIIFGEDVGFGGVFRCTLNLQVKFIFWSKEVRTSNYQIIFFSPEKIRHRSSVQHTAVWTGHRWFWHWGCEHGSHGHCWNSICRLHFSGIRSSKNSIISFRKRKIQPNTQFQIVNEAAKCRYRSGNLFDCGSLTIRAPCGAVGHGALYHSQSPESYFAHTPGLKIVVPRGPNKAKGLLLACIKDKVC